MQRIIKKLIWKFDILVYRLFYWRWRRKFESRSDIRKLFLGYLTDWEEQGRKENDRKLPFI
jgi:hypothetical protein